jgi:hypothetical protein
MAMEMSHTMHAAGSLINRRLPVPREDTQRCHPARPRVHVPLAIFSYVSNAILTFSFCGMRNLLMIAKTGCDPVFGFDIVTEVPGVPSEILVPRHAWGDKAAHDSTARKLAGLFNKNFETYAAGASAEVKAAAPVT